jgi:ABC-type uncharacterized transport system ATPase subunit
VTATALELRGITRRFGEVVALAGASLKVRRGTVHAVLGENGAGKTTLMRVAYGLLASNDGDLRLDDVGRSFRGPSDAIAAGVGMVQQHPSNVPALAVWENVVLGGTGMLEPANARHTVEELIEQLGFSLDAGARVGDLSVAAQQRLEILKAVFRKARLLILDEPTAVLAPEEARDLYAWLRRFATEGGTAVVVTHKLDEAREFTDDLTVLRAGRTVLESASASVTRADLTLAMIGETLAAPSQRGTPQPGDVVLQADGIVLTDERGLTVVRDATLDVRAGEILGIAGVEGSGHHALLLALAGRHETKSGRITGPARTSLIPVDRHQDAVVLSFSLTENAAIKNAGARRGVIAWSRLSEQVRRLMEAFDVRAVGPHAPLQTLSGGNQQKFVLSRELSDNPQLIVAENPTRGLDIRASAFVREQLRAARDAGAAVVLYSSDLDELMDLADRVLVVHAGRVSSAPLDRTRIGAAMLGAA